MMKKLLAMLLAVLMLISACAVAEEAFGGQMVIKDVVISVDGETALDLTGVDLALGAAFDGTQGGLHLALDAAGANVLNAVLALDSEKLTLRADGLSDVYAVRYEDLINMLMGTAEGAQVVEAFMSGFEAGFETGMSIGMDMAQGEVPAEISALMEHAVEIFPNAIADGGTETIDGVEYTVMDITISEEQMGVLLNDLIAIADAYAQSQLAGSGYDSFRQLVDETELRLSVDGKVYTSENEISATFALNAMVAGMTEPATVEMDADIVNDAENGVIDLSAQFYATDGDEREDIGALVAALVEMDGEFAAFEMSIYDPSDENSGVYLGVYAPAVQGNGLWQFSIGTEDAEESAAFHVAFGNADGLDQFSAQVISGDQSVYLDYLGADGEGNLSFGMVDGDESTDVSATVAVTADDGAWLPGAVDAVVDLLTLDEEQSETLTNEGMMLLLNAVAGLGQANESLAAMIGGMMG